MARGMDCNAALFGQHGDEREFLEQKIRLEIEFDNSARLRFSFRASARWMSFLLLGLHSVPSKCQE
jgi:aspartate carbamoyltransferase catalytic subunit